MKDIVQDNKEKSKVILNNNKNYFFKSKINSKKLKNIWKLLNSQTGFFILILILSTNIAFFLGKLSEVQKYNLKNKNKIILINNKNSEKIKVVASKKGSVFHFPWCSGASTIKEKNKIYFENKTKAIKAGLKLAKNCEDINEHNQ